MDGEAIRESAAKPPQGTKKSLVRLYFIIRHAHVLAAIWNASPVVEDIHDHGIPFA